MKSKHLTKLIYDFAPLLIVHEPNT